VTVASYAHVEATPKLMCALESRPPESGMANMVLSAEENMGLWLMHVPI
jgi:hypothetical protein